jgi:simple sugar transport system substrate-binding protein
VGDLYETGAVDLSSFWDPAVAGEACNKIALMKLGGETVAAGADLGLPGYEALTGDGNVLYGQAWVDVTAENKDEYPF